MTYMVYKKGYCCCCDNLPYRMIEAVRTEENPCNGCWCTDLKPNWEPNKDFKLEIKKVLELIDCNEDAVMCVGDVIERLIEAGYRFK